MLYLKVARNYYRALNAHIFLKKNLFQIFHHFFLKLAQPSSFFIYSFIEWIPSKSGMLTGSKNWKTKKLKKIPVALLHPRVNSRSLLVIRWENYKKNMAMIMIRVKKVISWTEWDNNLEIQRQSIMADTKKLIGV